MTVTLGGQLIAQLSGQLSADDASGPTMPRLLLGVRLRRLREECGLKPENAARAVGSEIRLASMELGLIESRLDDVVALCDLYGVEEHGTRVALVEMARQSRRPGWWQPFHKLIPAWFLPYLGSEQTAAVIRSYAVQSVPDLLQTEDYARAQLELSPGKATDEEIERRVQLRMGRQRILRSSRPTRIWTIIDEAALRRPVGGPGTMRGQLEHLRRLCALPNITVQVLPFALGGHPALGGPITLLRWRHLDLRDLVFLEQMNSGVYPFRPGDRDYYRHAMNLLGTQAPPPDLTPEILDELINSM